MTNGGKKANRILKKADQQQSQDMLLYDGEEIGILTGVEYLEDFPRRWFEASFEPLSAFAKCEHLFNRTPEEITEKGYVRAEELEAGAHMGLAVRAADGRLLSVSVTIENRDRIRYSTHGDLKLKPDEGPGLMSRAILSIKRLLGGGRSNPDGA